MDDADPPFAASTPNPFAGFETHTLSNGVRVRIKHLPGVPNALVSARGSRWGQVADPRGRGSALPSVTVHMLFADHSKAASSRRSRMRSEGLGGRGNGST